MKDNLFSGSKMLVYKKNISNIGCVWIYKTQSGVKPVNPWLKLYCHLLQIESCLYD